MKKIIPALVLMMAISIGETYGQQVDTARISRLNFIKNLLKTDGTTALQVSEVQDNYKQALKKILINNTLSEQQRRLAIDSLVNRKNRRLEELLPENQRNLLIPTTERRRTWKRDTTLKKNT